MSSDRYNPAKMVRKIYAEPRNNAAVIARECVYQGYSNGWLGDVYLKEEVEKILAPFNIVYTDDMWGEWTPKKS